MTATPLHPVNNNDPLRRVPASVTERVLEVRNAIGAKQRTVESVVALGGYSPTEIVASLYAWPFPRDEWARLYEEAL